MDATFVLVPGAGGAAWYWHRLVPELERRGHSAIPVGLPTDDDSAGLAEYADVVVEAIGDRRPVVLVAQSLGGFTAPLVCERVPVDLQEYALRDHIADDVAEGPRLFDHRCRRRASAGCDEDRGHGARHARRCDQAPASRKYRDIASASNSPTT